ncbi:EamA family transporter [Desulfovibrio cuneatus]|uniref:EamA family transporter n=1 Tax=Desulfovibrio cuneatus TaxID=159728 RepID=UPI0004206DD7|nr:EamA family transporter [Desulfovibrio cuneatus]
MNPYLWLALFSFAIGMLFWAKTLRALPLATAYSWTALTYVLVPFCGALLWQERLALPYFIGLGCIIAGVFITTRPTRTSKST